MPEIHKINNASTSTIPQSGVNEGANAGGNITVSQRTREIPPDEFFRREKRKNHGLIEKLYNQIKNVTGLGLGTKKVKRVIEASKQGKASSEDVINTVNKYSASQENAAQLVGDAASIGAGAGMFFFLRNKVQMACSIVKLNKKREDLAELWGPSKKILELVKSNKKLITGAAVLSALTAGWTKSALLSINRIGSEEYKLDEKIYGKKNSRNTIQRAQAKAAKKQLKKEHFKSDFRNFASGTINGLMLPLMGLGGIIGAPLYLIGNSLNRYFVATKTDKNKSFSGYADNLKNDALLTGAVTIAGAIPLIKKGNFIKVADANLKKATEKLEKATLKAPDYAGKSATEEIQEALFRNKTIEDIIYDRNISVDEQIKKLTDENIFAVKFKQISGDSSELTRALRENCPPSRTLDEARTFIKNALGDKYSVNKLLGVGTVAETYLAKNSEGKDVCIKIIKKGIDKDKILRDKEKFIDIIKNSNIPENKQLYLQRNIDDLAEGILKEIDLKNEMEAAKKLMPNTKVADVVKPIEVKNGVYVMEKANGISLGSLVELNVAKLYKEALQKNSFMQALLQPPSKSKLAQVLKGKNTAESKISALENYIKQIEARTPEFGDITLSKDDAKKLIHEYMKVLTEQFVKVEKGGKAIHADIHPGNIFIDINALKKKNNNKIFTLIDTGNIVEQSMEQSLRALNLTSYTQKGNVKDITDYVLDGAALPSGMSKEEAVKKVSEELRKSFFDTETTLDKVTNESILKLGENIMRKYGIVPADTQLNLNKARQSSDNSLEQLYESLAMLSLKNLGEGGKLGGIKSFGSLAKDWILLQRKYNAMKARQEKLNLNLLSVPDRMKQINNPNNLKTNSEDYFIYKLKQNIIPD